MTDNCEKCPHPLTQHYATGCGWCICLTRGTARDLPNDPVLAFIYDPAVSRLVTEGQERWPWSRLSGSRLTKIAYKLIVLRCAQLGIEPPTRQEAALWRR